LAMLMTGVQVDEMCTNCFMGLKGVTRSRQQ
jgi:hypothetical protein